MSAVDQILKANFNKCESKKDLKSSGDLEMRVQFGEFHSSGAEQVNALLPMDERPDKGLDEFEIYY